VTVRVLVWQWGRRGAGPLVAVAMARQLAAIPGVETCLSLSTGAELLGLPGAPVNDLPVRTYEDRKGFAGRIVGTPLLVRKMADAIRAARVDVALCAMPAPLDFAMAAALRRAGVRYAVVVHDAQRHPGDTFPLQMQLQRWLLRGASMLFALSSHVEAQLLARGFGGARPLHLVSLPPFVFWPPPPPVCSHGGRLRVLSFGRLLPYKGLDLLADALMQLGERQDMVVRVVGSGPEGPELERLRSLPNVTVENRWVPEAELGALLGWADALVLSHREASQSGVAAAAIAARRWVVSTRVGGLVEQLEGQDMAMLCEPDATSLAKALAALPGRKAPTGVAPIAWSETAEVIAIALRSLVFIPNETIASPRRHDAKVA
jgi:glycosyltransferase involved in cell wall biosynthesis